MNDSRYPWVILVPRIDDVRDITDLSGEAQITFNEEISRVAASIKKAFRPERMNIAMLGNIVSQLHCHIIARFKEDISWPKPVWGIGEMVAYSPEKREEMVRMLRKILLS